MTEAGGDRWRSRLPRPGAASAGQRLSAITGSPGVNPAPSGAFGRAAKATSHNDDTTRNALFITGEQAPKGDPAVAARELFGALNWRRTGHREAALPRGRRHRLRAGTNVVLQQTIEGHDIVGANLKATFAQSGAFVVTGRPLGDVAARRPSDAAGATPEEAGAAAAAAFDLEPTSVKDTKLEVFPWTAAAPAGPTGSASSWKTVRGRPGLRGRGRARHPPELQHRVGRGPGSGQDLPEGPAADAVVRASAWVTLRRARS